MWAGCENRMDTPIIPKESENVKLLVYLLRIPFLTFCVKKLEYSSAFFPSNNQT